jgi:predicted GIY-YIG superfamily endonuclease
MRYVYLLRSESTPKQTYIGSTTDFQKHLKQHNSGESPYTARFRPRRPVVVLCFDADQKAEAFERYLKSGSGHAFAKRNFW